jgi:hypothetical protein
MSVGAFQLGLPAPLGTLRGSPLSGCSTLTPPLPSLFLTFGPNASGILLARHHRCAAAPLGFGPPAPVQRWPLAAW